MARLTEIASELKRLLEEITIANGFEVDMGTINEHDAAHIQYPSALITYTEETADTSTINGLYGHANVEFQIKITAELLTVESKPVWAIDEQYDKVIAAMKKKFGENLGELALDYTPLISYKGFTKDVSPSGDVFVPGSVTTKWQVRYQYAE